MQLEDYFDFLAPNDIRLKGHRIGIESVLYEYIHRAQTPEEIAVRFPTLSLLKFRTDAWKSRPAKAFDGANRVKDVENIVFMRL